MAKAVKKTATKFVGIADEEPTHKTAASAKPTARRMPATKAASTVVRKVVSARVTAGTVTKKAIKAPADALSGIRMAPVAPTNDTPIMWYKVTEQTRFVLNNALARNADLLFKERETAQPDGNRIGHLMNAILEIRGITRDPKNFQSIEKMQELTLKYRASNGA